MFFWQMVQDDLQRRIAWTYQSSEIMVTAP
jgi:hypothetical protein